jgi:signal peptidase I
MGDNRDNSKDSRFWGFARREDLIGKPLFVYWSYSGEQYVATDWNLIQSAKHYGSVAVHFFTRTRWFRTGTILR